MPSKEFLDSDVHLGDERQRGTRYWNNKSIMEWVEAVPTPSEASPSVAQDPAPEGAQTPTSATNIPGVQRPIPGNNNQGHSLMRRNSRADLREEYQQDRPSSKGCNPC